MHDRERAKRLYRYLRDGGSHFRHTISDALGMSYAEIDRAALASDGYIVHQFGAMLIRRITEESK